MMKCKQYVSLAIISIIIIIFVSVIGLAIITIMTINVQAISDPQSAIQSIPVHNRVAMINFDDGWVSQYILGKPILDEFGYKASYFLPCANIGLKDKYLSWAQVAGLSVDFWIDISMYAFLLGLTLQSIRLHDLNIEYHVLYNHI